jgi:hypothetical protein
VDLITTSGTYSLTVTNKYGCSAASSPEVVTVNPAPTVALSGLPDSVCNNAPVSLAGGTPTGGTFSGVWVSDGVFHANLASAGSYTITYSYTGSNNCIGTATGTIVVSVCTGIDDKALDNIRVFPNPAGDLINVYSTANQTLTADLTDVSGKAVIEGLVISGPVQTIGLTAYSAGVYLLRLHDKSGNMKVVKVVKE